MNELVNEEMTEFIRKKLKRKLTTDRYKHTMSVANTCQCLAMSIGEDVERAYIAGLLHDCAKCIPDDKKISKCEKYGISISEIERKNPELLHSKLGAHIASKKYNIDDKEMLSAIECHTTGKPDMTNLEMIVFVADYIEPGRYKAKNLNQIRKEAFSDIRFCVYHILKDTLEYLKSRNNPIDDMTEKTFDYYRKFYE